MKFYTFGKSAAPVILLLPGTCCHWKRNFGTDIRRHELQHEQLLTQYPEKWVEEIRCCSGFRGAFFLAQRLADAN